MNKESKGQKAALLQGTLDMLIMQTLRWGPEHGHGIGQAIQARSGELLHIEAGSLYPALHRLENRGWLAATWKASDTGRDAKFYRLTPKGKAQLSEETANWARLAEAIRQILRTAEGGAS